jgi:hypothetical protein
MRRLFSTEEERDWRIGTIDFAESGCSDPNIGLWELFGAVDKYVQIRESTASECLDRFCKAIIDKFGEKYLRLPTVEDLRRIMQENPKRGFAGMIGSIDCYNWKWKNARQPDKDHTEALKERVIMLEAAVSYDLWF